MGEVAKRGPTFPRLRWVAVGWLVVWTPTYAVVWGWRNFLQLCDVAVFLTTVGLWRSHPLLLSSQAVSSIVIDGLWTLDVGWRLASGRHLIGGTEYMWDGTRPLPVRLMSLFHAVLPPLLVWCLKKEGVGYDRRALRLQIGIAAGIFVLSRLIGDPRVNPNFAFRDPFLHRAWGPPLVHAGAMFGGLVLAVYWPTHAALRRLLPPARR